MDSAGPQPGMCPRVDPFLLPSPTTYRFVLLMVVVASATCVLGAMLHNTVQSNWDRRMEFVARCSALPNPKLPGGQEDAAAGGLLRDQCMAPVNRVQGLWILAGLSLLVAVAGLLYWTAPALKIRRSKLTPLSVEDAPEVMDALAQLCRTAGLARPPQFVWSPTNAAVSGVAFGRRGRYYVALTGGLVARFFTDPPCFRAIVLHELAHLHNRDIDLTYLAVATWRAFVIAVLIPFAISRFFIENEHLFGIAWRLLALTGIVLLTRNEVLRTREFYADLRAHAWESDSALPRVLAVSSTLRAKWRLWRWLDFHPSAEQRRAMLADATPLFRPDFVVALATGATATIAIRSWAMLFQDLFVVRFVGWFDRVDPSHLVACAAVGGLSAYVLGSELWESALLAASRAVAPLGGASMGAGLALGTLIGNCIDLSTTAVPLSNVSFLGLGCWVAASMLVFVLVTKGFGDSVHAWLALGGRRSALRRARIASLALYGALLTLWLAAIKFAEFALVSSDNAALLERFDPSGEFKAYAPLLPVMLTGMTLMVGAVPTVTTLVLGAVPFLLRLGTSRDAPATDAVLDRLPSTDPSAIRAWRALALGIVAGLAPLLVGYLQHGWMGAMLMTGATGLSPILIVASIAVAALVARNASMLGWLQAMTAGFGAGAITWGAVYAVDLTMNGGLHPMYQATPLNVIGWLVAIVGWLTARTWRADPAR